MSAFQKAGAGRCLLPVLRRRRPPVGPVLTGRLPVGPTLTSHRLPVGPVLRRRLPVGSNRTGRRPPLGLVVWGRMPLVEPVLRRRQPPAEAGALWQVCAGRRAAAEVASRSVPVRCGAVGPGCGRRVSGRSGTSSGNAEPCSRTGAGGTGLVAAWCRRSTWRRARPHWRPTGGGVRACGGIRHGPENSCGRPSGRAFRPARSG